MSRQIKHFSPDIFWDHVDKGENANSCWRWIGPAQAKGSGVYGYMRHDGKTIRPEFWVAMHYTLGRDGVAVTPTPGMKIKHHFGNTLCVRPDHLYVSPNN